VTGAARQGQASNAVKKFWATGPCACHEGGVLIEAPEGTRLTEMRKTYQRVVDRKAEIATFRVSPWTPGQVWTICQS
jgi:hypothetical protein